MPNTLQLGTAIQVPNMNRARISRVLHDEDAKRLTVEIFIGSASGVLFQRAAFSLVIANGQADGIGANTGAAVIEDVLVQFSLTGPGVALAYDTARDAYRGAGNDKRGNLLTALTGISGTVMSGPLAGQTLPILPPGSVS